MILLIWDRIVKHIDTENRYQKHCSWINISHVCNYFVWWMNPQTGHDQESELEDMSTETSQNEMQKKKSKNDRIDHPTG